MNGVFRDYPDNVFIIFLDDILIYSKTKEDHKHHLRLVLKVLRKNQLNAKLRRCTYIKGKSTIYGTLSERRE